MDDQNVIRTMEHKRRFGRLPGIKLSETLLAAVGNPQKGAAFIHIAGPNGKGDSDGIIYIAASDRFYGTDSGR